MRKTGLFEILEYSKPFHICIQTHVQKSVMFTKIGKSCVTLEIQNPSNIDNHGIFITLTHLKCDTYSEPSQRFKLDCFEKIVKSCNHFSTELYLRTLTRVSIRPFLNKYSLTSKADLRHALYETYLELWMLS